MILKRNGLERRAREKGHALANPQRRQFLDTLRSLLLLGLSAPWLRAFSSAFTLPAACAEEPAPGDELLPAVAFYYGANIPVTELKAFDWVVLEPDHALAQDPDLVAAFAPKTLVFAYVSVGEVLPKRSYYPDLPKSYFLGVNAAWGSYVIDQTATEWPKFLRERILGPLWQAGFRAFFLDTLDSYRLLIKSPQEQQRQAEALARTLGELPRAFPGIRLLLNRGFELIDGHLAPHVLAVAAESLYRGWNQNEKRYFKVSPDDRAWLLERFAELRRQYGILGIAVDYCSPSERALARETAQCIASHGLIPWVADPQLQSLGVGAVEVVPRRVLLLHANPEGSALSLPAQAAHTYGALPLEYLGLVPEYRYADAQVEEIPLAGRYAGVVLYLSGELPAAARSLIRRAREEKVPIVFLGAIDPGVLSEFGVELGNSHLAEPITLERLVGSGEFMPYLNAEETLPLSAGPGAQVWLRAKGGDEEVMDGAAVTTWGGYALGAFGLAHLPAGAGTRWAVDPIEFLRAALRLGDDPMPDVTTRTGRRVFFVHLDGEGWVNRCERPGAPLAGEVLVRDFLERYRVPTLGSVVVGEVSPFGLYPQAAAEAQKWAKSMFALPWVEVGCHTWSRPLNWAEAEAHPESAESGNRLPLPGYRFNAHVEIGEAASYIERHLAPPGKRCLVLLWPGDGNPPPGAVALAYALGLKNLNGGGGAISKSYPSLSAVWPMGIPKGKFFQVYAPAASELAYTNSWQGPYYSFVRVIESYQLTETPRRLKPINLHFHAYLVTKPAGEKSLHEVYRWALAQAIHPIFASQYCQSVLEWQQATVARLLGGGWRLRGGSQLRQWVQPIAVEPPLLAQSRHLAGWNEHGERRYLHATADEVILRTGSAKTPEPRLCEANAEIASWQRQADGRIEIELTGHVPVEAIFWLPPPWKLYGAESIESADGSVRVQTKALSLRLQLVP